MKQLQFRLMLILLTLINVVSTRAQSAPLMVKPFEKVIVSPHIEVKFIKGETESVLVNHSTVTQEKINIEVTGKTLRVYLDEAKVTAKTEKVDEDGWRGRRSIYYKDKVQVTVYYKTLTHMSIRGEEQVSCESSIETENFRLKTYGEPNLRFKEVHLAELKATCYGEAEIVIESGSIESQKYLVFGESSIDASTIQNTRTKVIAYGESDFKFAVKDDLKVSALGETMVEYSGSAKLRKGLVLGENSVNQLR